MHLRLVLLGLTVLLFAGCLPESKNPIAPIAQTVNDPRLDGVWEHRESDGNASYYHFHRRTSGSTKWVDVVNVEHPAKSDLQSQGFGVLPATIGGKSYLSFRRVSLDHPENRKGDYSFARYDFNWRGDLRLWLAEEDAFADAVRAGKLRGTAKSNRWSRDVKLTDSSERISAFVAASDDKKIFRTEALTLKRLRPR